MADPYAAYAAVDDRWESLQKPVIANVMRIMIDDLREELRAEMRTSLRIAILEQGGLAPKVCGTYDSARSYDALNIVAKDGATFIAKRSGAGECPGEDWQILACTRSRGRQGPIGPRGERGPAGPEGSPGRPIAHWHTNLKDFTVTPVYFSGGIGPVLDLRPLFAEFLRQIDAPLSSSEGLQSRPARAEPPMLIRLIDGPPPAPVEDPPAEPVSPIPICVIEE